MTLTEWLAADKARFMVEPEYQPRRGDYCTWASDPNSVKSKQYTAYGESKGEATDSLLGLMGLEP